MQVLSGTKGSVRSPAKLFQLLQQVLNYVFEGDPATDQGKHTEMRRVPLGCANRFGLFWQ